MPALIQEKAKIMKLGVNIDHVATLREARKVVDYPSIIEAALSVWSAGADSIVIHLREDHRHIKEKDAFLIRKLPRMKLNLEMSINKKIVDVACRLKPDKVTIVPERRQEVTTEGGLDLSARHRGIERALERLRKSSIGISVFIDPFLYQVKKALKLDIAMIELHTGKYCESKTKSKQDYEFKRIYDAARFAYERGMFVAAGHGLNYNNVRKVARIKYIKELNIGHSIVARAVFKGLPAAVKDMKQLIS